MKLTFVEYVVIFGCVAILLMTVITKCIKQLRGDEQTRINGAFAEKIVEVEHNGHKYLWLKSPHGDGGFTHDPDCSCTRSKASKSKKSSKTEVDWDIVKAVAGDSWSDADEEERKRDEEARE